MLSEEIKNQINEAMKSGDKVRVDTLKMLSSALHNAKIGKGLNEELSESEEQAVVVREAKKRKDTIQSLEHAQSKLTQEQQQSAKETLEREKKELEILEEYLPEQMSDQEMSILVDKAIAMTGSGNIQEMGRVIGKAMELAQGRADGSRISEMVKEKLI